MRGLALLAASLVLASCLGQAPPAPSPTDTPTATPRPTPSFAPGTFGAEVQARGKLRVGVVEDRPGFSVKSGTGYTGFDADMARQVARTIFGYPADADPDRFIEWVPVVDATRASVLADGKADVVVAAFSPQDAGAQDLTLSDPYYLSGLRAMAAASSDLLDVQDLHGRIVCVERGSPAERSVVDEVPGVRVLSIGSTQACAEALGAGQTDAMAASELQLFGLRKPDTRILLGRLSDVPFVVAAARTASGAKAVLDSAIAASIADGTWADLYRKDITPISGDVKRDPRDRGKAAS